MGDSIGTHGEVLWLERVEATLYQALIDAVSGNDYHTAEQWVDLLERLSII